MIHHKEVQSNMGTLRANWPLLVEFSMGQNWSRCRCRFKSTFRNTLTRLANAMRVVTYDGYNAGSLPLRCTAHLIMWIADLKYH